MVLIDELGNTICVDEETAKKLLERPGYRPLADEATSTPERKRAAKQEKK